MRCLRKSGFTLIELLVVIAIVGTLVGLLLPAVNTGHRHGGPQCRNNLRQLSLAVKMSESAKGYLPGYINDLRLSDNTSARASWPVMLLPYLDQRSLWGGYQQGKYEFPPLEIFQCFSDPNSTQDQPFLSYVANAGFVGNSAGEENKANGVFFDRTRTRAGASGPEDGRDIANSPLVVMTSEYLRRHDGLTHTLLLSESTRALHWGYTTPEERENTKDRKYHFGFCWDQPSVVVANEAVRGKRAHRINGYIGLDRYQSFDEMTLHDGFPSSNHPELVVVAFAGGNAKLISQKIDPLVYAQLMTSNHKESDLVDLNGIAERELEPLSEKDF